MCRNYAVRLAHTFDIFLTCTGPIHLSHVPRWRYRGHHKVERDGEIHGSHGTGTCANHTNLVMGLEIHVGCTPCSKEENILIWLLINCWVTALVSAFMLKKTRLTITAAVINRSRNEGFPGIIHRCAHESTPLWNKFTSWTSCTSAYSWFILACTVMTLTSTFYMLHVINADKLTGLMVLTSLRGLLNCMRLSRRLFKGPSTRTFCSL